MVHEGKIVFTGTHGNICFYFTKAGKCIGRMKSSITGARIRRDPAFEGFRESSNRMKDASPIAAQLYRMIPKAKREYRLYRVLTGEALRMLKAGMHKTIIVETLKQKYIDRPAGKRSLKRQRANGVHVAVDGIVSVVQYHHFDRHSSHTKAIPGHLFSDLSAPKVGRPLMDKVHAAAIGPSGKHPPPGAVCLGRTKQYPGMKMWLMPHAQLNKMPNFNFIKALN